MVPNLKVGTVEKNLCGVFLFKFECLTLISGARIPKLFAHLKLRQYLASRFKA